MNNETDLDLEVGPEDLAERCTDAGNGKAFWRVHKNDFRYLTDRKVWLKWDNRRWKVVEVEGPVTQAAKHVAKKLKKASAKLENDADKKMLYGWAIKSLNLSKINAMIKMAASEPEYSLEMSQVDNHHHLINVQNGTIDLRTGELRPHSREDYLTTITEIVYDSTAQAPRWAQFLPEVFANDMELVSYVQRAVGYSLTGATKEQCFFLLFGDGENGKGRFLSVLRRLGGDAAQTTAITTLTAKREIGTSTPALAKLSRARIVTAGEPDEEMRFSEATIKAITGEEDIEVRALYEAPFEYKPKFKVWVHVNPKPKIKSTDHAFWRRPKLIPFLVTFDGKENNPKPDKDLDEKLNAEIPGILAWAVEGAKIWYQSGLGGCKMVDDAISDYRKDSDHVGQFVEDTYSPKKDGFVPNAQFYNAYVQWCDENGVKREDRFESNPLNKKMNDKRMKEKGYSLGKGPGLVRGVRGLERKSLVPNVPATEPRSLMPDVASASIPQLPTAASGANIPDLPPGVIVASATKLSN